MLIFNIFESVKDTVVYGIIGLLAVIDGVVFKLVSVFFKLFYALAEVQLLDNSIYRAIADRVYLFIGVIALFMLSSSLLKALVNPDEINKGVIKSFKSLITSVILVVLIPTIFKYAFSMQSAILSDNIIGKIFQIDLNKFKETGESPITNSSDSMYEVCNFETEPEKTVSVKDSSGNDISGVTEITHNECQGNYITLAVLEAFFTPNNSDYAKVTNPYGTSWADARLYMVYTGNFNYMATFAKNAYDEDKDNSISYSVIISTVSAGFLIYLLLSFSIDLGVRAAKLAFYQLIAPIPVLMKMIPGKEGQFDKWSKATISVFLELFVRLIVIEFAIFMCSNLFAIVDSMNGFSSVGLIGKAILAMGLFAFAKQAPKLLGEALGFEAGNLKFGIKGKLADGGFFAATGALGAAATAGVRNLTHSGNRMINGWKLQPWKNGDKKEAFKGTMGAIGRTLKVPFSTTGGAFSGLWRGAKEGYGVKDYSQLSTAAGKAAADAIEKRDKRESYRANHNGPVALNHAKDLGSAIKSWATGSTTRAVDRVNYAQSIKDSFGDFESLFSSVAYNQKKSQLDELKALQTAGVSMKDGQRVDEMIKKLEGSMLGDRIKSITKNTQGYAYNLKQIADAAKKKPELMQEIGLDKNIISKMDNYRIRGNEIVDKNGNAITAKDLISMYEGSAYSGVSYNSSDDKFYYGSNEATAADLGNITDSKDGYRSQKAKASAAVTEGKTSIEYKEAMKKQNDKK